LDGAAGQLPRIVRAHVGYRVILAIEIEHRNLRAVDVGYAKAARHDFIGARDAHPVAHRGNKSCWGAFVATESGSTTLDRDDFDVGFDLSNEALDPGER